jgi:threonine dehydrogenase-like Zn-dependent dehydrogenase
VPDDACDVAFECSGKPAAFEAALGRLRKAGRLVILGTGMERPRLDANRVLLNELVVTGGYTYDATGLADALALLASGALPTELLIEPDDVPLEGMLAAMEALAAGRVGGKVMVAPGARAAR